MDQTEVMKLAVQAHNCIVQIPVSGDSTILMANAITALRELVGALSQDAAGRTAEKE